MELRHHGLHLRPVQHPHQYRLDHIVKVMSERDLVAAKFLCLAVQISAPHPGAQIAGRIFYMIDRLKNIGSKDRQRNVQTLCIVLDQLPVFRLVARIHDQKSDVKRKFVMPLQLLKKFCHQHRILAAGDADCNPVALLHEVIRADRLCKPAPQILAVSLPQILLDLEIIFVMC